MPWHSYEVRERNGYGGRKLFLADDAEELIQKVAEKEGLSVTIEPNQLVADGGSGGDE